MERVARCALITRLVELARKEGIWCGEIQIQIMVLFVQDLMDVPLGVEFVLYRRGPFSFDLRDELTGLRADGMIELELGPDKDAHIVVTDRGRKVQERGLKAIEKFVDRVEFIVRHLGGRGVVDSKRLAATYYVMRQKCWNGTFAERAKEVENVCGFESQIAAQMVADVGRLIDDARCYIRANGKGTEGKVALGVGSAKGGASKRRRKSNAVAGQQALPAIGSHESRHR